jgi:hypothetical protein
MKLVASCKGKNGGIEGYCLLDSDAMSVLAVTKALKELSVSVFSVENNMTVQ